MLTWVGQQSTSVLLGDRKAPWPRLTDLRALHAASSKRSELLPTCSTDCIPFPTTSFRLFSPFFQSTFHLSLTLHSSLSVFEIYLALGENYLPLWYEVPIIPTRRKANAYCTVQMRLHTGFSPSLMPCSKELTPALDGTAIANPKTTIRSTIRRPDFKFELCPLHSPLLGASMFFSFPGLSNLLKFSP